MASNTPRPTKAERREAARAKAKALREEQERRERAKVRRRWFIGAGIVVVGGGGLGLGVNRHLKNRANRPVGTIASPQASPAAGVPGVVLSDGGWTYGKDSAIGAVTEGAAVLDVFYDYSCHFCAEFDVLHTDEISSLLRDGRITLALHPCKILGSQWTDMAMNAVGLVLDEAPDTALAFHNAVFAEFDSMVKTGDGSRQTVETIVSAAGKAGVPEDVSGRIKDTITAGTYGPWVSLGTSSFSDRGFTATPTVLLRGDKVDLTKVVEADGLTKLLDG